jgi:mono/diheme cytochrome c family protein
MALVIPRINSWSSALIAAIFLSAALHAHGLNGAGTKADEEAGALLFRDKGCAYCHGTGGIGGKKAPSLAAIRTDKDWPPAKITNQILSGGQKMPPFGDALTDEEISQLVAYLRAKNRPTPPAPAPDQPSAPPQQ